MTPIPTMPTVVVLIHTDGSVAATASNISEMKVVATYTAAEFDRESCNRAFIDHAPDTSPVNSPLV